MNTRNDILAGLLNAPDLPPGSSLEMEIDSAAQRALALMSLLNGGNWRMHIDHKNGFLLIAKAGGKVQ